MKQDIKYGHATLTDLAYWINERHSIYIKRMREQAPWPWTQDPILQQWCFTNAFRQLDKGTMHLRCMLRKQKTMPDLLIFNIIWYRLFNWYEHALNLGLVTRLEDLEAYIRRRHDQGRQIFTSAHMTTGRAFEDKHETYLEACQEAWKQRSRIAEACRSNSMEHVWHELINLYMVGGFVAYEIACDLRFEVMIQPVIDRMSWANMGPGAQRGLKRLGFPFHNQREGLQSMIDVYRQLIDTHLLGRHVLTCEWPFELREVEHSLCEFDKYQRVKTDQGRPRRKFRHQ